MNIFKIEEQRLQLNENLLVEKSSIGSLILINSFFDQILKTKDEIVYESFLTEFSSVYIQHLQNFNSLGMPPEFVNKIIENARIILESDLIPNENDKITEEIRRLSKEKLKINSLLQGDNNYNIEDITFPVNVYSSNFKGVYGQIENVSIKIHYNKFLTKNKFLVVPSSQEIDERLQEQINTSWELALKYLSKHHKSVKQFHEVIIVFEHKYASYEGNSLGLALTLGFIHELFNFYNTHVSLKINKNLTFTGGVEKNGSVTPIGPEIIATKIKTVFYSPISLFAIPDSDYDSATDSLNKLKETFPERKLKLIRISEFEDLLNNRQIVDIKKVTTYKRTDKLVRNNKVTVLLSAILIALVGFLSFVNFDNNPHEFKLVGETINILNKHGKVLWSKQFGRILYDEAIIVKYYCRIYDVDDDGINEVLLTHEVLTIQDIENQGRIACFDFAGKLIWKYKFRDSVATEREIYKDEHLSRLIDIKKVNSKTILFAASSHFFFPSAVYKLDAKTGKRIEGTLWSQGHFGFGEIEDYNNDGELEIFIGGINNGLESAFALLINLSDLNGQTPSTNNYLFKDIPMAKMTKFLLFEKTDICEYFKNRFNGTSSTFYQKEKFTYNVGVNEYHPDIDIAVYYAFNNSFDSAWTLIGDAFQFNRDSLIIKGELNPPFTNDKLYNDLLVSKITEWDGEKFVRFMKPKQ